MKNIDNIIRKVLIESFLRPNFIFEDLYGSVEEVDFLNEAEYQGRKVQLGKIMQGDVKKFKVYVKNDKGKVVKATLNMTYVITSIYTKLRAEDSFNADTL